MGVTPVKATSGFATAFQGRRGIVAFDVAGWSDASGHVALWNGTDFRENDHDDYRLQADDPATEKVEATTKGMILWPL